VVVGEAASKQIRASEQEYAHFHSDKPHLIRNDGESTAIVFATRFQEGSVAAHPDW
jgi:hypothetical protein